MSSPKVHFVISAPRSGSTWLAQALNQHPEIFATEHRLFGNFCEMWPNNNGKLAPRITFDSYARALSVHYFHSEISEARHDFIENFTNQYCRFLIDFARKESGKSIIVDKITPYPGTTELVVTGIRKHFPDSKVLKLTRDGRDVATSGTFDWLLKDAHGTDRYACFVENDPSILLKRFFDDDTLKKWVTNWRETIADVREFAAEIRYEDMLTQMPSVLSEVFDLLGADNERQLAERCADAVTFEKTTGRRNGEMIATAKQRSGVSGQWESYFTRHDGRLFHKIAGRELMSLGYVNSEKWFEALPEELDIRCEAGSGGHSKANQSTEASQP